MNPGNRVFSVMLYTLSALACYIFDTYQPMLIVLCRQKGRSMKNTVQALFFAWPFLCNTSSSTGSMLEDVRLLRHLLLPQQRSTNPVTCSFCNNWYTRTTFQPLLENSLTIMLTIVAFKIEQIINENFIFFSKRYAHKLSVTSKMRHFRLCNLAAN